MEKRGTRLPVISGFSFDSESEGETGSREAGFALRPSSFCRVPRGTFVLRKEMGIATLCSCGLQLLPAGSEMRLFLPLCRLLLLFGRAGNQSWDSGWSTQRRADFIFEREMPSGTLPPALDLNRHELLGRTEG